MCVCVCVITEITGDVMEHEEPQPPWPYSSQTKIALLWLTTRIHARDSKYQPADHFYKLYSIHIRDYVQSGNLWLPNIAYSDCNCVKKTEMYDFNIFNEINLFTLYL